MKTVSAITALALAFAALVYPALASSGCPAAKMSITVDGRNNDITYLSFNAYLFNIVEVYGIERLEDNWMVMWGVNDEGQEIFFYTYDGFPFYRYWTATVGDFEPADGWDYVTPDGFEGDLYIYAFPHAGNAEGNWWWADNDGYFFPLD